MPIVNLSSNFIQRLGDLEDQAAAIADALKQTGDQRAWQSPGTWAGPFDPASISSPYDRTSLNNSYISALTNAGNKPNAGHLSDLMAAKVQGDYLAVQERAFRLQQSSSIRCRLHAAARRSGHSLPNGIFGAVSQYASDVINSGTGTGGGT